MKRAFLSSLCLATALAGCATGRGSDQPEFVGRTMDVVAANGQASTLSFRPDGVVVARFGSRETQGRWDLERRALCFTWAQTHRECWPYARRFRPGRTVTLTSDRGNVVTVTMR